MASPVPSKDQNMNRGKTWKFGDDLNTDEIIPARYNITIVPAELAKNVFCEIRPDYPKGVQPGDVVVGGQNFGCGSSREHAPIAIKGSQAACVIAASFARIFFRNAINIGLPILECPEAVDAIKEGDEVEVDLAAGKVRHLGAGKTFTTAPFPRELQDIIAAGGLMNYARKTAQK